MGKVNVIIVDATGNKEQKVGLPDDIKCGIIMVKLVEKIKLPSVGPDGNPISYKFIHKVTGRQLLEAQTLAEAGIKDGDVLRLQPEITAGAICSKCGSVEPDGNTFCAKCGSTISAPAAAPRFCSRCGNTEPAGSAFCSKCGNTFDAAPAAAPVPPAAPAYGYAQPQYAAPAAPAVPASVTSVAKKVKGKGACGFGVFSGWLSIIFGLITFMLDTGSYESNKSYGGDAYTGIQNAAAQSANNIMYMADILKTGMGFMLIVFGLFLICYFTTKKKQLQSL